MISHLHLYPQKMIRDEIKKEMSIPVPIIEQFEINYNVSIRYSIREELKRIANEDFTLWKLATMEGKMKKRLYIKFYLFLIPSFIKEYIFGII